jgi:hypothetical protein
MSSTVVQALEYQKWNMTDFEFNFELPNTATSQPLDPSIPIDVEFFNNWTNDIALANLSSSPTTICKSAMIGLPFFIDILPSPAPSPNAAQQVDLPTSITPMSGSTEAEFDQFLHDLGMLSQPTQHKAVETSPGFLATIPQAPSQLPQVPKLAGVAGDDWSTYLESASPSHHPTPVVSSQPNGFIDFSAIPNFDPSMLKPPSPPSPTDIIAQNEAAAKRAKLEQWRAHLEAAKKLEQELTM